MANEFDIFQDPNFFNLWCLRQKGEREFAMGIHFEKKVEAAHAESVIRELIKREREACAQLCEKLAREAMEYSVEFGLEGFSIDAASCAVAIKARGGNNE